jgi:hypothetical protein
MSSDTYRYRGVPYTFECESDASVLLCAYATCKEVVHNAVETKVLESSLCAKFAHVHRVDFFFQHARISTISCIRSDMGKCCTQGREERKIERSILNPFVNYILGTIFNPH